MHLSRTRLVSLRKAAGYSQPALAQAAAMKVGTLRSFEQGRHDTLKAETVYRIAQALDVPMETLFADEKAVA